MKTDETQPRHWFLMARERMNAADAVHAAHGACWSAVELLQESVERYLKGYLIGTGWGLQRTHNLSSLLDAAVTKDQRFQALADLCDNLNAQFWAQHYPGGDLTDVGSDFGELRSQADELVKLIRRIQPQYLEPQNLR